jgi:hypothetical protein
VKSMNEYSTKLSDGDCVWLFNHIKAIMLQFEGQKSLFLSISDAVRNFAVFRQNEMTLTDYKNEYEILIDVFEHYGGVIGGFPKLVEMVDDSITETIERSNAARNQLIAVNFLARADRRKY